ncbi:NYN domain-containing protein [Nocardioides sp. CPCC 206347]|uniref:NYN domain-containing protein n=1 Tax=unclassified Nocardioides TaxID=2615069 RepID=UPI0036194B88
MRSTCSVYVDVGYLLASAATRVTGTSLRASIHVEFSKLVESLVAEAEKKSGLPVLRVHWYDSAKNGVPDVQQERIGELAKVKLRLGRFGVDGQQKGVDLRIGLDLVAHARNGAADVFFLVTGDDDLTEAVEEAQVHGVQVVVVAVPNADGKPHGVSRHLVRAADELDVLSGELIDNAVMKVEVPRPVIPVPVPAPPVTSAAAAAPAATKGTAAAPSPLDVASIARHPTTAPIAPSAVLAYSAQTGGRSQLMPGYDDDLEDYDEQIDGVASRVLTAFRRSASTADVLDLRRGKPSIPRDIDRALLLDASDALGMYDVSEHIRYRLRERFWQQLDLQP